MSMRMQPGDIVRHFKGNRYEILYFARDSETQADVVVYRALYSEPVSYTHLTLPTTRRV